MSTQIPDGYELLPERNKENAKKALARAVDKGFPASAVLTHRDGYLIPLSDDEKAETLEAEVVEITAPSKNASKAEIEAFAEEHNIDLGDAGNNEQRLAAIEAEIARRTEEAEASDVLTDGSTEKED